MVCQILEVSVWQLNQVERATAHGLLGTYFAVPAATATETEKDLQGLAEYLLDTRSTYHESRFGAYVIEGNETAGLEVSYFHNSSAFHGVPIFLSMIDSAVYAYTSGNPSASIKVRIQAHALTLVVVDCRLMLGV